MERDHPGKGYILIVDDDPDVRTILAHLLHIIGWDSASASRGSDALACIELAPPAVVLLDLMMPHMNGFEVLSCLKANPVTRDVPVIIVSALAADKRLERLGASALLPKGNISVQTVRETIQGVIQPRSVAHSNGIALPSSDPSWQK